MSAQPKLLYILPDVAYTAELLPAKQPNTFAIHSFRQINGEFITEDEFIAENLTKLLDKLEPGEYQVVLPDFLFTNTILNVKAASQTQVTDYIKSDLLPSLEIDKTTHQIETFVLTEHKGVYKLQLSALEKSLVKPLAQGMADRSLLVASVVSVSWALKSIISLEPSISIVQLGEQLYLTQHYIGIDQAMNVPVAEAENLVDTIKTLKGAEPSIQTIYLLTSELVGEKLRQGLHDTVPLQQLAVFSETEGKMPAYLKQAIEASMKTLATPEYELPKFNLEAAKNSATVVIPKTVSQAVAAAKAEPELVVQPSALKQDEVVEAVDEPDDDEVEESSESGQPSTIDLPSPAGLVGAAPVAATSAKVIDLTQGASKEVVKSTPPLAATTPTVSFGQKTSELKPKTEAVSTADANWLKSKPIIAASSSSKTAVIKNKSDVNELMKLIAIGVASFVITVGIGIGLGLGLVFFTNNQSKPNPLTAIFAKPTPLPSATPTVVPTPTASPSAQLDLAKTKILVVNATSIAGHAGKMAATLKAAGITQVSTGNAKGEYDKGVYLLTTTPNQTLYDFVKTEGKLASLSAQTNTAIEDPAGDYTGVIVLAE